jgi:hypothetical protein
MASEIKVNTIKDLGGNTIVSSNGSGTISGLPASAISSGTVATARLGSGTASSSTFLAGDSSYKTVTGVSLSGSTNNTVATVTGANALLGETNLIYDGTRLGVGGTGASADLGVGIHVRSADSGGTVSADADELVLENSGNAGITFLSGASDSGRIFFGDSGSPAIGWIRYFHDSNHMDFGTNESERMRILTGGEVLIGTTSNTGKLCVQQTATNAKSGYFRASSGSYTDTVLSAECDRNTSNSTYNLYKGQNGAADRIFIRDSGNIENTNNSYGAISDERIKQDITDANSQWDDIKAVKVRNFKLKNETDKTQLGVIAQELEASGMGGLIQDAPPSKEHVACSADFGSIDEEGVFTKGERVKAVKYSVLYMKSIKCLQEAMEKIETLEAKVTALENA